ncbi:MAG: glycosyltransferase family 2 protein [Candidatus Thiodiazotropha sp. (ex Lucinoma aequizonata)]|nr:glycosyltransferase family 2 protein [Candidatus Thiodiazotropha sp. (ex Lucinoma aequizonata)]MCU7888860.1 glycosyltransferase family 2 protein [Candidatus Thiodiazotropha sp. (ex Lucinoma aequizonata)]MCU7895699.1 glycosyltransferase family 2 protein [Candidatus Thiodiazotropha sp. (ex Lucinoma aequizonata)]MCU7898723.1 glycosyltransferase family 2 protein [Candidatus Thiodiazotropha sp. (ex Lucinoma aequizonata)]MCU7901496.1 glycosyltransferase family 2 protein [Candidatus Thiodiazotropha
MKLYNTSNFVVVIPAYNEAATIQDIVSRVLTICQNVIVVNDGSKDQTLEIVRYMDVSTINHKQNMGKANSLWDGIQAALAMQGIKGIITIDADGQHLPEDIPRLIKKHIQHPDDVVIGARLLNQENAPKIRLFANKFADFLVSLAAGRRIYDSQSGFRLYPTMVLDNLWLPHDASRRFVFESQILIKIGEKNINFHPISIESIYLKDARPSHFRPIQDISSIVLMLATSLFIKFFNMGGLYKVIFGK